MRREQPIADLPERPDPGDAPNSTDVLAVLANLPQRRRACVVLRYYCDLSVEQTAEILGISPGTVKSQTARGLETLRAVAAHLVEE
jgi:RNA polymerase sigma factor (sigma-70 family)